MQCLRRRSVPDHNVGLNPIRLKACHQFFSKGLRDIDYPFHDKVIVVINCGRICLGRQKKQF
jgi:hypothetical protein